MSTSFRLLSPSTRLLGAAAVALAVGAPAAGAQPAIDPPAPPANVAPAPVTTHAPSVSDGFDWGDAAVGAGGVAGLVALLAAGSSIVARTRIPSAR